MHFVVLHAEFVLGESQGAADRPSGAILAAFGRRQPPSGRLGLRPSFPANLPKGARHLPRQTPANRRL